MPVNIQHLERICLSTHFKVHGIAGNSFTSWWIRSGARIHRRCKWRSCSGPCARHVLLLSRQNLGHVLLKPFLAEKLVFRSEWNRSSATSFVNED